MDRAVGYSEGWWQHRAESGDVTVRQLFAVLDHLGLDPVRFVRSALPEPEQVARLLEGLE